MYPINGNITHSTLDFWSCHLEAEQLHCSRVVVRANEAKDIAVVLQHNKPLDNLERVAREQTLQR